MYMRANDRNYAKCPANSNKSYAMFTWRMFFLERGEGEAGKGGRGMFRFTHTHTRTHTRRY